MSARTGQFLVVDSALAGIRLADFLLRELPQCSRLDLRQLVRSGALRVNGEVCLADRALRAGDAVQLLDRPLPRAATARLAGAPEVLFESGTALVIDKPAGLPTVPDRSGRDRGVHGLLAGWRPDDDLRIVHRLDRDTSGCLLLAKGLTAARHFDVEFRAHRIAKTYVALVHGVPGAAEFAIDAWLGPDRRRPGRVVIGTAGQTGFRDAHTRVVRRQAFKHHALLTLLPTTGRGHQLRVHLQSVGHPIVGDTDYGGELLLLSAVKPGYKQRRGVAERPLLQRLFLHSEQLVCRDVDGQDVVVGAPLPRDLQVALRQVEAAAQRGRQSCG